MITKKLPRHKSRGIIVLSKPRKRFRDQDEEKFLHPEVKKTYCSEIIPIPDSPLQTNDFIPYVDIPREIFNYDLIFKQHFRGLYRAEIQQYVFHVFLPARHVFEHFPLFCRSVVLNVYCLFFEWWYMGHCISLRLLTM